MTIICIIITRITTIIVTIATVIIDHDYYHYCDDYHCDYSSINRRYNEQQIDALDEKNVFLG